MQCPRPGRHTTTVLVQRLPLINGIRRALCHESRVTWNRWNPALVRNWISWVVAASWESYGPLILADLKERKRTVQCSRLHLKWIFAADKGSSTFHTCSLDRIRTIGKQFLKNAVKVFLDFQWPLAISLLHFWIWAHSNRRDICKSSVPKMLISLHTEGSGRTGWKKEQLSVQELNLIVK